MMVAKTKQPAPDRQLANLQKQIAIEQAKHQLGRLQAFNSMAESSGYITPGSGRRSMRGWAAKAKGVDADTLKKLPGLRGGSRDLAMNTPLALAALRRVVTNAVGWGLTLQANVDREVLGLSAEEAAAWQGKVERHWRYWCYSQEADAGRQVNFQTIQGMALFNMLLSGDCFVLLPHIKRPGSPYRLKVKLLEADYVANPPTQPETSSFAAGIEYDQFSAPVAYHVKKFDRNLPLETNLNWSTERVLAFGTESGRRNMLHIMLPERIGQRRGLPFLSAVIERLKQISRLGESELAAAVVASYFAVFVKGPSPIADPLAPSERAVGDEEAAAKGTIELAPGMIMELGEGQSGIDVADPKRPNGAFEPFFMAMVKEIGANIGIPFEVLMQHFQSSYSAARAAILEAWKKFMDFRHFTIEYLNDPVYEAFLDDLVSAGIVQAPGYFEDFEIRQAWLGCRWTGRGQGQINPAVETDAALKRIGGLLSSYEEEVAAYSGERWEAVAEQRQREESTKKRLGISAQNVAPLEGGAQAPSAPANPDTDTPDPGDKKPGQDSEETQPP